MSTQTLFLTVLASSMALSTTDDPEALISIKMQTQYAFDDNVVLEVLAVDEKTITRADDPLSNIGFKLTFADKVDGSRITQMNGYAYTGGGAEELEEKHSDRLSYITSKLDFFGALDNQYDFFESVETRYNPANHAEIMDALTANGVLNQLGAYRTNKQVIAVPASTVVDMTPKEIKDTLLSMRNRPRYLTSCEIDSLSNIEALVEVVSKVNGHLILDIGDIDNWESAVAFADSININDHRVILLWNPNKARPSNSTTILGRKKWRPCAGDYLAQLLIRNSVTTASGIPPLHKPIAGYKFPLAFRDMEAFEGLVLDEEAQNALADAGINVVINEVFGDGDRWIFGDALTQYDAKTSALQLSNASEVETYTANGVIAITKKHLLKDMSSFEKDTLDDCERFLDACAVAGLIVASDVLGGKYYALEVKRRTDSPFTKADIKLSRKPEGCARQAYFESTITK